MANALIQPYVAGVQSAFTCPLYDPRFERESRGRFSRAEMPENRLHLANSLYCPAGRWAARAYVLLRRGDYNNLNLFADNLQLALSDGFHPTLTFGQLTPVRARCVSRGNLADPNAIYLVELTDRRGILHNQWFSFPTISSYNVRAPAYPERYYDGSLNAGNTWSWNGMIQDLWNQMTAFLGPYPGLPITPAGLPENFSFNGVSCWLALCAALDLIGCYVTCDLTATNPYGIVSGGAADTAFTGLQSKYANLLEDDLEPVSLASGRGPKQVAILFHRRNQYYGTEETIRLDSFQWSITPHYAITIPAPAPFNVAQGTHFLWDDFTVRFDTDNNPLAADVAMATTIANERVTQYFARIYRLTLGSMHQDYGGVLPFVTGSQVDGVAWHQDFPEDFRLSWQTTIVRGPQPPWEEVEYAGE